MHAPPPYPSFLLPEWPACKSGDGLNGSTADAREHEEAMGALPRLGFSLLFERTYTSLDTLLENCAHDAEWQKRGLGGQSPRRSQETISTQWFRHPAGILCLVQRFKHRPGDAWLYNGISLNARMERGWAASQSEGQDRHYSYSAGQSVELFEAKGSFTQAWEKLRKCATQGLLMPFCKWEDTELKAELLKSQSWPGNLPKRATKSIATPGQRYRASVELIQRHAADLAKPWLQEILAANIPAPEKLIWERLLAQEVIDALRPSPLIGLSPRDPLPRWAEKKVDHGNTMADRRQDLRKHAISTSLHEILRKAGHENVSLTEEEREITARWISVLSDRRHPRLIASQFEAAQKTALPRLGINFSDLLFGSMHLRGVARKASWWQAHQEPTELLDMCKKPGMDGKTLPQRWVDAWLCVPNERVWGREQLKRQMAAQKNLEMLMAVCPADDWAMATPVRSMWDGLLELPIRSRGDQDFLGAAKKATLSLSRWILEKGVPVPTHLTDHFNRKTIDLLQPNAIEMHCSQSRRSVGQEAGALLDEAARPISLMLAHRALSKETPGTIYQAPSRRL